MAVGSRTVKVLRLQLASVLIEVLQEVLHGRLHKVDDVWSQVKDLRGYGRHGGLDVAAHSLLWQARIPWPSYRGAGDARMQSPAQLPAASLSS